MIVKLPVSNFFSLIERTHQTYFVPKINLKLTKVIFIELNKFLLNHYVYSSIGRNLAYDIVAVKKRVIVLFLTKLIRK